MNLCLTIYNQLCMTIWMLWQYYPPLKVNTKRLCVNQTNKNTSRFLNFVTFSTSFLWWKTNKDENLSEYLPVVSQFLLHWIHKIFDLTKDNMIWNKPSILHFRLPVFNSSFLSNHIKSNQNSIKHYHCIHHRINRSTEFLWPMSRTVPCRWRAVKSVNTHFRDTFCDHWSLTIQ